MFPADPNMNAFIRNIAQHNFSMLAKIEMSD